MDRQLSEAEKGKGSRHDDDDDDDDDGEEEEDDDVGEEDGEKGEKDEKCKMFVHRKDTERQLGEAKRGLAEASRDGQAAAARIKALHVELEEVSFSVRQAGVGPGC